MANYAVRNRKKGEKSSNKGLWKKKLPAAILPVMKLTSPDRVKHEKGRDVSRSQERSDGGLKRVKKKRAQETRVNRLM